MCLPSPPTGDILYLKSKTANFLIWFLFIIWSCPTKLRIFYLGNNFTNLSWNVMPCSSSSLVLCKTFQKSQTKKILSQISHLQLDQRDPYGKLSSSELNPANVLAIPKLLHLKMAYSQKEKVWKGINGGWLTWLKGENWGGFLVEGGWGSAI